MKYKHQRIQKLYLIVFGIETFTDGCSENRLDSVTKYALFYFSI